MKCSLCDRTSEDKSLFEFHHFEPIATRRKSDDGIVVCHQCGDQLHLVFTNYELRSLGNDIDILKRHVKFIGYLNWVKKRPIATHYTSAAKKKKI